MIMKAMPSPLLSSHGLGGRIGASGGLIEWRSGCLSLLPHNCTGADMVKRRRSTALNEQAWEPFCKRLRSAHDIPEVGNISIGAIVSLLAPDLVLFMLRDGDALPILAAHPSAILPLFRDTRIHRVSECLCGMAVSEGKPIYSGNIHSDPRCTWKECKNAGYHSFAAIPLTAGQKIISLLGVGSVRERDFAKESEILEAIASRLAEALVRQIPRQGLGAVDS